MHLYIRTVLLVGSMEGGHQGRDWINYNKQTKNSKVQIREHWKKKNFYSMVLERKNANSVSKLKIWDWLFLIFYLNFQQQQ